MISVFNGAHMTRGSLRRGGMRVGAKEVPCWWAMAATVRLPPAGASADAEGQGPVAMINIIVKWYLAHARTLPWRGDHVSAWAVLVSEVMLQQTPVSRVKPVFIEWMARWPTPAALAAESPGEAVRAWGRLGYPRRALRLHAAASVCVAQHGGEVPDDVVKLRALPGVGDYTSAAVASFAYAQRHAVLDTNVRRVHARLFGARQFERPGAPTKAERTRALELLPLGGHDAAQASIAVMEFGALICTARTPNCDTCPMSGACGWLLAGRPPWSGPERKGQTYAGTDRQCRGRILQAVRDAPAPVLRANVERVWDDHPQLVRALTSLLHDELIEEVVTPHGRAYRLPQ